MAERPSPVERGFFREAEDGATVFFPWGLTRQGYRLPDAAAKQRAARAVSLFFFSLVAAGVWGGHALHDAIRSGASSPTAAAGALVAPLVASGLGVAAYVLWAARFVEDLPPSDLRVSREARLRGAAEVSEPRTLIAVGAILAAMSAAVVVLEPRAWWVGALGVALGVGTVAGALALRRIARKLPDEEPPR